MVAEDRVDRGGDAARGERAHGRAQQTGMERGIDVRAVVEGIGVAGQLHAEVAVTAAAGCDAATVQHGERVRELVDLVVVDQIAALDDELRPQRTDRVDGARQHLDGQRLMGTERRLKRRPEAVEERHAGGR